ncbi:MAG TPA: hypothetical protein VFD92_06090 [Candidatus Binatia bacterium]|nr:hypothetical protein [Candidatus Binatia bacterium]
MRRLLMAAAIVLLAAFEAHGETLYVGNAFLTSVTPQCGKTAAVGDAYRAIYRPAGVNIGNGADSHFSLTSTRANVTMRVPNNSFQQNVNYVAQTVGSSVKIGSHAGGILGWTESGGGGGVNISVTTSLAKFFGVKSCTATIDVYLTRLPAS